MRILFLGINYAPEEIGTALYSTGLCEDLASLGHSVRAIVGQPYYPQWRIFPGYEGLWKRTVENGVDITRCPLYVPAAPSGIKRLIHHGSFALSAFLPIFRAAADFEPDLVLTVAPSLVSAPLASAAARFARARSWLHIQDFEVETAFATGLLDETGPLARLARAFEHRVVRGFEQISSISPEMCRKLETFGIPATRIREFRNWAEVDRIRPLSHVSPYREEWRITAPHVALYSGNIANKQGIEIVIGAARRLAHRRDLVFVICGQGLNKANLEREAAGLGNILFRDLQPAERLGELLGLATVHLLPQKADAADLVLPSKLTNMLASGRPVVATAAPGTGLAREIGACGLLTSPGSEAQFAAAIERLLDDPTSRASMGDAARQRAVEVWRRERIIAQVERNMRELCASGELPAMASNARASAQDQRSAQSL